MIVAGDSMKPVDNHRVFICHIWLSIHRLASKSLRSTDCASWFQKPGHLSKTGPVGLSYKETIDRLRKVRNLPIHACWKLFVWSFRTTFKKHVYANSEILLSDGRLQNFLFFLKNWKKKKRKIRENENMYFSAKNIQFWVLWFYHHFFQEKSVRGIGSQNFDTTSISKVTNDLKKQKKLQATIA